MHGNRIVSMPAMKSVRASVMIRRKSCYRVYPL